MQRWIGWLAGAVPRIIAVDSATADREALALPVGERWRVELGADCYDNDSRGNRCQKVYCRNAEDAT